MPNNGAFWPRTPPPQRLANPLNRPRNSFSEIQPRRDLVFQHPVRAIVLLWRSERDAINRQTLRLGQKKLPKHICSQTGCADGSNPNGTLIQTGSGTFYGSTGAGGT